jgi:hypothetical protein
VSVLKFFVGLLFLPLILIPAGWCVYVAGDYLGPIMIGGPIIVFSCYVLGGEVLRFFNGH